MQARNFLLAMVLATGCAREPSEGPQIIYESGGNGGHVGRGGSSGRGGTGAGAGRGGASAAGGTAGGSGGSGAGGTAGASGGTSGASDGGLDAVARGGTGGVGSGGSVGSAGSGGAATGGTGGSAGTSTGGDGGPVTGFSIQYKVENTSASGTAIGSQLWIVNSGTSAVNLNDLTLRYYFTNEVTASLMQNVNWANVGPVSGGANMNLGSGELTIKTERMPAAVTGADSYVEFGFNAAGKMLAPGSRVQFSWTVQNFGSQNFNQTGDYSFNAGYTSQTNWQNVVLFQGQSVLWGVQP
jgi:hypothetical protein